MKISPAAGEKVLEHFPPQLLLRNG